MWLEILKRTTAGQNGGTYGYSVVMENKVNTHDVRTGLMRWNLGKSSQRSEQFDAVIILNGQLVFSTGASLGALKGDSLLEIRANGYDGPTVPILYGLSDRGTILGTGKSFSSAPCTTGVSSDYSAGAEAGIFYKTGSTRGWITAGQFNGYMTRSSAVPSGGFRQLINEGSGRFPFQVEASGIFCNWCDSLSNYAANDSVVIWEVPYTYKTGGSTVIFDYADGNGDVPDSLVNFGATVTDQPAEGDAALMLMGLARLDSLSGHKVFDPAKLPIRLGVTVDAAVCNTANRAGPGIIPSDSSVVKATIDSIVATNALGGVQIKLTVGVNVDSLQGGAKYNSQLGWWRRLGMNVRFSPQVWPGVTTPSGSAGLGGLPAI
jgi:hypothetical protein